MLKNNIPDWIMALYWDNGHIGNKIVRYRLIEKGGNIISQTDINHEGWENMFSVYVYYIVPLIKNRKVYKI